MSAFVPNVFDKSQVSVRMFHTAEDVLNEFRKLYVSPNVLQIDENLIWNAICALLVHTQINSKKVESLSPDDFAQEKNAKQFISRFRYEKTDLYDTLSDIINMYYK
jgi:hypothetical protein